MSTRYLAVLVFALQACMAQLRPSASAAADPTRSAPTAEQILADPQEKVRAFIRTRASLDPDQETFIYWTGSITELLPRVAIEECAVATLRRVDEFVRRKGPTWDLVAMTEQQGEQTQALSAASGVPDGYRDDLGRFGPAQIVAHDGG